MTQINDNKKYIKIDQKQNDTKTQNTSKPYHIISNNINQIQIKFNTQNPKSESSRNASGHYDRQQFREPGLGRQRRETGIDGEISLGAVEELEAQKNDIKAYQGWKVLLPICL